LQAALCKAVGDTFNAVTVDGDQSTNDTVLLLANGHSGVAIGPESGEDWLLFETGMHAVCHALAQKIVGDGEKITKVVEVNVEAAATAEQATAAARAIGNSLLVKTSWYGSDPNWGRLLDAVGYSGAETSEQQIEVYYADVDGGQPVAAFVRGKVMEANVAEWKRIVAAPRFRIQIVLGTGAATARIWATDLTEGYVHFNKSE
jgi:glutamate N-acetyltransferase/amino-acid N-acetyltransferase